MQISLELLKMLRHTGSPLDLRVNSTPAFPGGEVTITREDTREVQTQEVQKQEVQKQEVQIYETKLENVLRDLGKRLIHYPQEVRINGETLERTPFKDTARVTLITYVRNTQQAYQSTPIHTGDETRSPGNALAGGVLCDLFEPVDITHLTYYTVDQQGPHQTHWKKLAKVMLQGVMQIPDQDVEELIQVQNGKIQIDRGSELNMKVAVQMRDQFQKTMSIPEVPEKYEEPAFHRIAGAFQNHPFLTGVPIGITTGIPMRIANPYRKQGEYYSAALAFYHQDSQLVPVHFMPGQDLNINHPHHVLEDFRFEIVNTNKDIHHPHSHDSLPHDPVSHDPWEKPRPAHYVDDIKLSYRLVDREGNLHHEEIPAPLCLGGEGWDNRNVQVSRKAQVTREQLTEHLTQAYWKYFEEYQGEELREELDEIHNRAMNESISLERPREALVKEITDWLGRFQTDYPRPDRELRINSPDGRMTLIIHPGDTKLQE